MVLHEFLVANRDVILRRCAETIRKRPSPGRVSEDDLTHGLPLFYDQLIDTLEKTQDEQASDRIVPPPSLVPSPPTLIGEGAGLHGKQLLRLGFTVSQVVHMYGTVCDSATSIAKEKRQPIGAEEFNIFNRCLDDAIAQAVEEYQRDRDDTLTTREVQHMGFLVHELRNTLASATIALQAIKRGVIGISGRTGAVLERSLLRMRDLIDRSLTEVRLLSDATPHLERLQLAEVIDEVEVTAVPDAESRGVLFDARIDPGLELQADRHMLLSAIANLVQNALKFTRRGGAVSLRAQRAHDDIVIAVEDECGGLAPGREEELNHPTARRSTDPSGLGLGLSIVHQAVKGHGGRIEVSNIPGKGCLFTIHIPVAH